MIQYYEDREEDGHNERKMYEVAGTKVYFIIVWNSSLVKSGGDPSCILWNILKPLKSWKSK